MCYNKHMKHFIQSFIIAVVIATPFIIYFWNMKP